METQNLNVVYATDNNYVVHAAVSIQSLLANTAKPKNIRFFILSNKLSRDNISALKSISSKFGSSIQIIDISNIDKRLSSDISIGNLSITTYSRLFVTELLPQDISHVLYLDCDTYVAEDIFEMVTEFEDIDNWYIAGAEDTMYPEYKEKIGLTKHERYLNAGVLCINLKKWRDDSILDKFLSFIDSHDGNVAHLDQGVLNGVCKDCKKVIPLKYNVQAPIFAIHKYENILKFFSIESFYSKEEVESAKSCPTIIHFTSFFLERPWFKFSIHPLKNLYRQTLKETPFADFSLQDNNISLKAKIKDLAFRYFQPLYLRLKNL